MTVTYEQVKAAFARWGEERMKAVDMLLKLPADRTSEEWEAYRGQSIRADVAHTSYVLLHTAYRNSGFDNEEVTMDYDNIPCWLEDEHSESNGGDTVATAELDNLEVGNGDQSAGGDLVDLGWL